MIISLFGLLIMLQHYSVKIDFFKTAEIGSYLEPKNVRFFPVKYGIISNVPVVADFTICGRGCGVKKNL